MGEFMTKMFLQAVVSSSIYIYRWALHINLSFFTFILQFADFLPTVHNKLYMLSTSLFKYWTDYKSRNNMK